MSRKITIYQSFVKYIKAGYAEVENLCLLEQFGKLVEQSGVKTAVERTCELSCDEAMIWDLDLQGRRVYGDTLLSAIGSGGSYMSAIVSVTLGESKDKLEERLNAIKGFQKPSKFVVSVTAVLTIAI